MAEDNPFAKLVPGFDFLQSLTKTATQAAMPGGAFGNWIAPTLDPEELDRRISELRTVQYWLEQNAKMLAATIQALEVQRMTLATLKSMNVSLAGAARPQARPAAAAKPEKGPTGTDKATAGTDKTTAGADKTTAGAVDAMQWWGALTQQFSDIASKVVNDSVASVTAAAREAGDAQANAIAAAAPKARRRTTARKARTT